jgi:hypothetical protein
MAGLGGYSRENEDEVIQELLADLPECSKVCVDIGAKMLENSNTANLIINHGWRGILIEAGMKCWRQLCDDMIGFPVCVSHARVTVANVNFLVPEKFDVLSIDIDGNDYWIWKTLKAEPPIVIIEYNPNRKIGVMKYDKMHEWKRFKQRFGDQAYYRFGASMNDMIKLGVAKGYRVHSHNDNNIFFIK